MAERRKRRQSYSLEADLTAQQPNGSYTPILKYVTRRERCSRCGRSVTWTAEAQRYWYEEMKGSMYARVNLRCHKCRS